MRILEGLLPVEQTMGCTWASAPFVACALRSSPSLILIRANPQPGTLLGYAAAFSCLLSALKRPSVSGSCTHPARVGAYVSLICGKPGRKQEVNDGRRH
jgi:cobalt/nickel transport system permease protein